MILSKLSQKILFCSVATYTIPEKGDYLFDVTNDDGVRLTIRNENENGIIIGSKANKNFNIDSERSFCYLLHQRKQSREGDVIWLQYDYYQSDGEAQAHLRWKNQRLD